MSICLGRRGWRMWSGLCLMLLNSVSSASSISWTIVCWSAGYKPAKQNQFCHHFNKVLCMYVSECRRWLRVGHGNGDVRCYVLVVSTWPRFAAIFLIVEFCVMSRDNWLFWCLFFANANFACCCRYLNERTLWRCAHQRDIFSQSAIDAEATTVMHYRQTAWITCVS